MVLWIYITTFKGRQFEKKHESSPVLHFTFELINFATILGEPFLFHLSTHLIPDGERYTVLRNLNRDKTYTINLQVFRENYGGQPVTSQHLLVLPVQGRFIMVLFQTVVF